LLWLDTCKAFWRRAIAAMLCCADSAPLHCTVLPAPPACTAEPGDVRHLPAGTEDARWRQNGGVHPHSAPPDG
jgi:hypothetical protein